MVITNLKTGDYRVIELNGSSIVVKIEEIGSVYDRCFIDYAATVIHAIKEKIKIDPASFKDKPVILMKLRRLEDFGELIIHYLYELKERKESSEHLQESIALEMERARDVIEHISTLPENEDTERMRMQQGTELFQLKRQSREVGYEFHKDIARIKEQIVEILKEYFDELREFESIAHIKVARLTATEIFSLLDTPKPERIVISREPEEIEGDYPERIP